MKPLSDYRVDFLYYRDIRFQNPFYINTILSPTSHQGYCFHHDPNIPTYIVPAAVVPAPSNYSIPHRESDRISENTYEPCSFVFLVRNTSTGVFLRLKLHAMPLFLAFTEHSPFIIHVHISANLSSRLYK